MTNEYFRQQLALLYELQEHDRELLSFHKQLQAIPKQIAQLEADVTKYKTEITAKTEELSEIEKNLRSLNAKLEMNEVQKEKYRNEQRTVTTNREYAALENQIEFLNEQDGETEEEILELMEMVDQYQDELTALESKAASEDQKTAEKTKEYREEQKKLKANIDKKMEQRKEYFPKIEKNLSTQYQRWMEKRRSDFVALGRNGTCGSCRLTIQPQNLKEAQQYEKLVYCTSCKRLLYVEPESSDIPYP